MDDHHIIERVVEEKGFSLEEASLTRCWGRRKQPFFIVRIKTMLHPWKEGRGVTVTEATENALPFV